MLQETSAGWSQHWKHLSVVLQFVVMPKRNYCISSTRNVLLCIDSYIHRRGFITPRHQELTDFNRCYVLREILISMYTVFVFV
jgi:hypothetical protein